MTIEHDLVAVLLGWSRRVSKTKQLGTLKWRINNYFINDREESQTWKKRIAPSRKGKKVQGDKPGMRGTRLARMSKMVRGQSGVSGASQVGLKISLYLILVVWEGTSSCRINVLTSSWNLLLKGSQTICVWRREAQKCVGWWLPVVTRQEVHEQGLLISLGQPTRLGKCLYLALEPEWKRP